MHSTELTNQIEKVFKLQGKLNVRSCIDPMYPVCVEVARTGQTVLFDAYTPLVNQLRAANALVDSSKRIPREFYQCSSAVRVSA